MRVAGTRRVDPAGLRDQPRKAWQSLLRRAVV